MCTPISISFSSFIVVLHGSVGGLLLRTVFPVLAVVVISSCHIHQTLSSNPNKISFELAAKIWSRKVIYAERERTLESFGWFINIETWEASKCDLTSHWSAIYASLSENNNNNNNNCTTWGADTYASAW